TKWAGSGVRYNLRCNRDVPKSGALKARSLIQGISVGSKMAGYKKIERCRASNSRNLISVLDLGHQQLTGVFPKRRDENLTAGPLELVWCPDSGLLQLAHTYEAGEMYGENYGYRSGLNQSMVDHLTRKIHQLSTKIDLKPADTVLDIG